MGDPKKIRKKFKGPSHPWQKERIETEKALSREYGLKTKQELWKAGTILDGFKNQVKRLNSMIDAQADKERAEFRTRLISLGLLKDDQPIDFILGLELKDLLERRLQTVLFRKNLCKTMNQARQFIVHRHVMVNGTKVTVPSYLVKLSEENSITFSASSSLSDPNHAERFEELPKEKETKKKEKKQADEEKPLAFDEVPEDEEAILKADLKTKKEGTKEEAPVKTAVKPVETKKEAPKKEAAAPIKEEVTEKAKSEPKAPAKPETKEEDKKEGEAK